MMPRATRVLHTVDAVFDELGGDAAVARLMRTSVKAVGNWRAFGKFPSHSYLAINAALEKCGCSAPDRLWTMTKPNLQALLSA